MTRAKPRRPRGSRAASRLADARGYTFVELLMSMMILTIGVTGVVALQKVVVTSNQHAKNLAIATQIAQAWIDQLHADAIAWNHPSGLNPGSDLTETAWLSNVALINTHWTQPAWVQTRLFGPAFNPQGTPINPASGETPAFCAHIRLSWLYQPSAASGAMITGNGLIRAEVRVFWLRDGMAGVNNLALCSSQVNPDLIGTDDNRGNYHFVYSTSAVRENTAR